MTSERPLPKLSSISASEEDQYCDQQGDDATLLSILQPVLTVVGTHEAAQFANLCKQVRLPVYMGRRFVTTSLVPCRTARSAGRADEYRTRDLYVPHTVSFPEAVTHLVHLLVSCPQINPLSYSRQQGFYLKNYRRTCLHRLAQLSCHSLPDRQVRTSLCLILGLSSCSILQQCLQDHEELTGFPALHSRAAHMGPILLRDLLHCKTLGIASKVYTAQSHLLCGILPPRWVNGKCIVDQCKQRAEASQGNGCL